MVGVVLSFGRVRYAMAVSQLAHSAGVLLVGFAPFISSICLVTRHYLALLAQFGTRSTQLYGFASEVHIHRSLVCNDEEDWQML